MSYNRLCTCLGFSVYETWNEIPDTIVFLHLKVSIKKTQRVLLLGAQEFWLQTNVHAVSLLSVFFVHIETWCSFRPGRAVLCALIFCPKLSCLQKSWNGRELALGKCVQYFYVPHHSHSQVNSSCRLSILMVKQQCLHSWCVLPCTDLEPWWCSCIHHGYKPAPKTVFRHAYTHPAFESDWLTSSPI
jgi:hypothetical protein